MMVVKIKKLKEQTKGMYNKTKTWVWRLQKMFAKQWNYIKIQQRFKSEGHNVCTEEINKTTLSSNGDKILQHIHMVEMLEKYAKQSYWMKFL